MRRRQPGVEAQLLLRFQLGRGGAALLAQGDESGGLRVARGDRLRERVIGRDRDEARAEDRVGAGREDLDLAAGAVAQREPELQPSDLPIQFSCISRTLSGQSVRRPARRAARRRSR